MNGRQCLGAVAIINDLSKERLLLEKQTRLERTAFWSELAAAMSHEVRNPLVAISTFAQLLPERYGDVEFRTDFSQLVAREISRLTGMIDQISEFAMAREPSFRPVAMDAVLSRAVTVAGQQHPSERTRVGLTVEEGLPRLDGDAASLTEAFAHLIVNAVEAAEKCGNPVVTVTARKGAGSARPRLVVRIQDNGKGIPPDTIEKVFSPFYSTKARGIGLGLPLAKRTFTDHSGQITMDSSTAGTIVTVVLPLKQEHSAKG
jgi:signal transduction histidine kinase